MARVDRLEGLDEEMATARLHVSHRISDAVEELRRGRGSVVPPAAALRHDDGPVGEKGGVVLMTRFGLAREIQERLGQQGGVAASDRIPHAGVSFLARTRPHGHYSARVTRAL